MHMLQLIELYLRLVNFIVCKFYFHKNYDSLFPQKSFSHIAELKDFYVWKQPKYPLIDDWTKKL